MEILRKFTELSLNNFNSYRPLSVVLLTSSDDEVALELNGNTV